MARTEAGRLLPPRGVGPHRGGPRPAHPQGGGQLAGPGAGTGPTASLGGLTGRTGTGPATALPGRWSRMGMEPQAGPLATGGGTAGLLSLQRTSLEFGPRLTWRAGTAPLPMG